MTSLKRQNFLFHFYKIYPYRIIIKKFKKKKKLKKIKSNNFYKYYFFITLSLGILIFIILLKSLFFNHAGTKLKTKLQEFGFFNLQKIPEILYYNISGNFIKRDKIYINISFKNYTKIEKNRFDRLEAKGSLIDWIFVNAKVKFNDSNEIKTKIRYKGDRRVHYFENETASFKLKLRDNKKILGLKEFTLSKPRTRNYLHEWIFNQFLTQYDLISPLHKYVDLYINGKNSKLYYLEEGFSKEMIERNQRKNGPIFSLNENLSTDIKKTVPEVYDYNYWKLNNAELLDVAATKLDNFFKQNININEVMNLDSWATFFALTDLNKTIHGILPKSVKYYFNPYTYKFEPIAYDVHYIRRNLDRIVDPKYASLDGVEEDRLLIEMYQTPITENDYQIHDWLKLFFENDNFKKLYFLKLEEVSDSKKLNLFFSNNKKKIRDNLKLIYSDYFLMDKVNYYGPGIFIFDKDFYLNRANVIKKKIEFSNLKVFFKKKKKLIEIINFNLNKTIVLKDFICLEPEKNNLENNTSKFTSISNKIFDNKIIQKFKDCSHIKYKNSKKNYINKIIDINYQYNYYDPINKNIYNNLELYFTIDNKEIFPKKNIVINQNIFIPKEYKVILNPNEKIIITEGAFIFSEAQWIAKGDKSNPVLISGQKNNLGGGIYIKNDKKNIFDHVKFENLEGFPIFNKNLRENKKIRNSDNAYALTGAINFYDTNVEISNSNFQNIRSEDMVNIVDSIFKIENTKFNNSFSDALDIDFSHGTLNKINILNSGNDCLDFSGTSTDIKDSKFTQCGDKAISVGENSKINIFNSVIKNSNLGIASKDGSYVYAKNISIEDSHIGVASYIKKNSYTHPTLKMLKFDFNNVDHKILQDRESKIFFNSKLLFGSNKDELLIQALTK